MTAFSQKAFMLTRPCFTVQRFQAAKTSALALTVALAAIFFQTAHAQNLALGKTCTAVNFFTGHPPSIACDGDYNGFPVLSYSGLSGLAVNPWLTVDLGDVFRVRMIAVLN